jgi:protein-disulfide isomerase
MPVPSGPNPANSLFARIWRKGFAGLCVGTILFFPTPLLAKPQIPAISPEDMSLGRLNTPVTLIVYGSITSAHFAQFYREVFPELDKAYIRQGQVEYIFREYLTPPSDISAAGMMMARCTGKDRYFKTLARLMNSRSEILAAENPIVIVRRIARQSGLSDHNFETCINDPTSLKRMTAAETHLSEMPADINMPYLFINGVLFTGDSTDFDAVAAAIDEAISNPLPDQRTQP